MNKVIRFKLLSQALQAVLPLIKLNCSDFVLTGTCDKNLNRLALELVNQYMRQTEERFWKIYWALLDQAEADHPDFAHNPGYEKEHLSFAISNAFFYYLSAIAFIPKLYKKKYGIEISANDYRKAASKIMVLGYQLSKFHFDVFRAFIFATSKTNSGLSPKLHLFDTECFDFDKDLVLTLAPKARALIKEEAHKLEARGKLRIQEPTIGCPALFVKDLEGRDMLMILHQQVLDCLEQVHFFESDALLIESI